MVAYPCGEVDLDWHSLLAITVLIEVKGRSVKPEEGLKIKM
jgi:Holliday junction resolvase-like predicted endonuclease